MKNVQLRVNNDDDREALLQRIAVLEKVSAKLLVEVEILSERNSVLELKDKPEDEQTAVGNKQAAAVDDMKQHLESSLNEVMQNVQMMSNQDTSTINFQKSKMSNLDFKNKEKKNEGNHMVSLKTGDCIALRHDDSQIDGFMFGDISLSTLGVKQDKEHKTNPRFADGVFRVCTALNFRARTEARKMLKVIKSPLYRGVDMNEFTFREQLEEDQNNEYLEGLSRGEGTDAIKFGDVIQLQHVSSKKFLATHKTSAPMNPNCRRVSLKAGSHACHFRILPRFKVRSIGSFVYAGDHIQLQSVKFPHLRLGVSGGDVSLNHHKHSKKNTQERDSPFTSFQQLYSSKMHAKIQGLPQFLRPPACLAHRPTCEVNASMDSKRSFSVKFYLRPSKGKHSLFSGNFFRLFHPEANAYIQASSDPDKGEVLDASGEKGDLFRIKRYDGTRAHIPYLKNFVSSSADASNPIFLSAKAVWCFEPVDNTQCSEVKFNSPLRLKHIPSGKYLSVDSLRCIGSTNRRKSKTSKNRDQAELEEPANRGSLYDVSLVFDTDPGIEEGKFGSASSVLFHLMPIDMNTDTLQNGAASAVRLEHRTANGRTLYFYAPHTLKSGINHTERPESPWGNSKERGFKICFSSVFSSLDVLRVQPLSEKDSDQLSYFVSKIRLFKLYAYRWHTSILGGDTVPVDLTEAVVAQCVDLLNVLRKSPPPPRHGGSISENMKEAQVTGPLQFGSLHAGAANPIFQKMCLELKLLDCVFDATVAPYNYQNLTGKDKLFRGLSHAENFKSVQMFLYVIIQCLVRDNILVQKYFTERYARVWKLNMRILSCESDSSDMALGSDRSVLIRRYELCTDLIIEHGTDSLGATVTLGQLLKSSETIIQRLVDNSLMIRFKNLVANDGPELRFINLFNAICFIEGRPSRPSQEMCLRLLWMNEEDRYSFGVTFHELPRSDLANTRIFLSHERSIVEPWASPKSYLGQSETNLYKPVCVCWTGNDDWVPGCGTFYASPKALRLPSVERMKQPLEALALPGASLVPLEHVMWVLEPFRLCKPATGVHWRPFNSNKRLFLTKISKLRDISIEAKKSQMKVRFKKQHLLATYINAELELLTKMCKGRSYNCIWWIENSFSYQKLLNMASNPLLPYSCNAAAMGLANAIYVDRFPQFSFAGDLPQKLWLFHDTSLTEGVVRKSSIPVLKDSIDLSHEDAFPAFFLPRLSSAYGHRNPVLSHPDHFKFYLLRTLYNNTIKSFGSAGRVIHGDSDFNRLGLAAIRGQQHLLSFGFQSTWIKLKELCRPNALLFDGRSDLKTTSEVFDPPESRYKDGGSETELTVQMKKELISTFNEVALLCTNFRMSQMLHIYKQKAIAWTLKECEHENVSPESKLFYTPPTVNMSQRSALSESQTHSNLTSPEHPATCPEAQYIMQTTDESVEAMYHDFEAMFPGGSGEAAQLDLKVLCDKPDLEVSLVDAIMYDDDELMAASLNLLDGIYGQRRAVRNAVKEVSLLDKPEIPVFGDIHVLKTQMHELMLLMRTASSWGVSSMVAGPFGNKEFSEVMSILDRLHVLLYDDEKGPSKRMSELKTVHHPRLSIFNPHIKDGLWTIDVAEKWSMKTKVRVHGTHSSASPIHQDLLRKINLQEVLIEAMLIDPLVARKDGTGTQEDMDESLRRLTMVMRAALSAASAFVFDNPSNQACFFKKISYLEKLAIPDSLSLFKKTKSMVEDDLINDDRQWSLQLADSAQVLILSILHKNTTLCDKVDDSLPTLFSSIADMSEDLSTASTLDIIFILVKPGRAPNVEVQIKACKYFLSFSKTNGLHTALALCMKTATMADIQEPAGMPCPLSKSNRPMKRLSRKMEDPARLLRLMSALMEGGNERVANMLYQRAGLTIDLTCATLVSHVENQLLKLLRSKEDLVSIGEDDDSDLESEYGKITYFKKGKGCYLNQDSSLSESPSEEDHPKSSQLPKLHLENKNGATDGDETEMDESIIDSKDARFNIVRVITEEDSIGAALFSLLIEQIFLLPLNRDQLYSESFWLFIEKVAVPVISVASRVVGVDEIVSETVGELVCALEFVLITLVRLALYERTVEDPVKAKLVNEVGHSVGLLLKYRQKPNSWLADVFREAGMEYGIEALNKAQFIELMEKACVDCGNIEKSVGLTNEITAAYDDAHVCGESGLIDMYEFIRLFRLLTTSRECSAVPHCLAIMDSHPGHMLRLGTIECAERIDQIHKGNGAGLSLKQFGRTDRYGSRSKPKHSSVQASLFASSHASTTKKFESSGESKRYRQSMLFSGGTSSTRSDFETSSSMKQKLEIFQKSVENNPLILEVLQRRRFSMVNLFENGTCGPPSDVGRNISGKNANSYSIYKHRHRVITRNWVNSTNKIRPQNFSTASIDEDKVEELNVRSSRIHSRVQSRTHSRARSSSVTRVETSKNEEAVIAIQRAYRQALARLEYSRIKAISKPGGGKSANRLSGAIALGWSDIAGRFIRYLGDHFWETGDVAKVNILIIETMLAHLIKARTYFYDMQGVRLIEVRIHKAYKLEFHKPHELSKTEFVIYNKKKENLTKLGVIKLLAQILGSLSDDVTSDSLPNRVVQLFVELLDGGNSLVQQTLYDHLISTDSDGKFLAHMEKRLHYAFSMYTEGKKVDKIRKYREKLSVEVEESCEHLIQTFRLLQLLCEDHHLGFQNYLRVQIGHTSSQVNIVKSSCEFVIVLCDSKQSIEKFSTVEISLVSQLLLLLIEAIQGPCTGNQELIVKSDVVVALDSIIYSVNQNDVALSEFDPTYMDLKSLTCLLLAAALEGREDDVIRFHLDRRLETASLLSFHVELEQGVRTIMRRTKQEGRLPTLEEQHRVTTKQTALVALTTVLMELGHDVSNTNSDDLQPLPTSLNQTHRIRMKSWSSRASHENEVDSGHLRKDATLNSTNNNQPLIGVVEVAWRGKVEKACFPIPFEVKYLPDMTKRSFLAEVDMSSSEKRMSALIKKSDLFIAEMSLIYWKVESSTIFLKLHTSLPFFKTANYGLVVALNLNILLCDSKLGHPYFSLLHHYFGSNHLSLLNTLSLTVTSLLGLFVTFGYLLIMLTMSVTELPLVIQQVNNEFNHSIDQNNITIKTSNHKKIQNLNKTESFWNLWRNNILALLGTLGLIGLHAINYPLVPMFYAFVFFMINFPILLTTSRRYVLQFPNLQLCKIYSILYDLCVLKSFLRNHLCLLTCCFLGIFVNAEFFSLLLLDVVSISPIITDIIKSVTSPGRALLLVFYLFCVTVLIWASFGMNHFPGSLQVPYEMEDGSTSEKDCGSMLQCFYFIFHEALSNQAKLKSFLATTHVGTGVFPMRIIYDSLFVVWVGIILLNVITGLMVDTFSRIREEKQARAISLSNDCFVCGILRQNYEDLALGHEAPSFDKHISEEHSPWIYLHYISYLKAKDPLMDSGIESYVRRQLDDQILEWIPARTSYYLNSNLKNQKSPVITSP